MKLLLAAGGDPSHWPAVSEVFDVVIGIDRGTLFLLHKGIVPDLAIGDFDSMNEAERKEVAARVKEVIRAPAQKDDTDTQLALEEAFTRYPKADVTLIGATGGRLDHLLANLWLGVEPRFLPYSSQLTLKDSGNTVRYLTPGRHTIAKEEGMTYLAFCCLTPVEKLTLEHVKYELSQAQILQPTSLASNEFLSGKAAVSFESGVIAVIQSKDIN